MSNILCQFKQFFGTIKELNAFIKTLAILRSLFYSLKIGKLMKRIPKNYDGDKPTSRQLKDLLPEIMTQITGKIDESPREVLEAWTRIVGPKISKMARAVSFESGVLKVKVENSTLYSLLTLHEKEKLLAELRKQFPKVKIRNIFFRIG
ncbi:putative uncharacterized protein [Simkania negevensis Z]|uniref:DUF721 domain-containing protein n=2 Tax=Simkania negevensis TaxID=83561 RepID=F8L8Y6_SIMNZ|nr:putative uncharacterized protein [Simkania negevensis Z]